MKTKDILFEVGRILIGIIIALLVGLVIILFISEEPGEAFKFFLFGPFSSVRRIGNIIEMSIPLIFTGLAVSVVFQAREFNIGAEGQFFLGAVVATIIGIVLEVPPIIHIPLVLLFSLLAGGSVGFISGYLKVQWGASELVSSLMMNYVCLKLGIYIINNFFLDTAAGALVSLPIRKTAWLQQFIPSTRIHWGIFIVIAVVILVYYFLYFTKLGYALRMTGINEDFANYSGIKTTSVILFSHFLSGALAGLGGAVEILGIYRRFRWLALPGYGFDGIIIATMARNNPLYVPLAALFLAYIRNGADIMNRMSDVPSEIVSIIQALIILLVTAEALLSRYYFRYKAKEAIKNA